MATKTSKPDNIPSVKTPNPPQQMDPSRKPVEKDKQKKNEIKPEGKKPDDNKKLAPNEEL